MYLFLVAVLIEEERMFSEEVCFFKTCLTFLKLYIQSNKSKSTSFIKVNKVKLFLGNFFIEIN